MEKIKPGAFASALRRSDPRGLFNHDRNIVLGRKSAGTLNLEEDSKGLHVEIKPPDTQLVRDMVLTPIQRGDVREQSFGFIVEEDKWEGLEDTRNSNLPIRTILKVHELFDISPVTFPAYPDTTIALRSLSAVRNRGINDYALIEEVDRILSGYPKRSTSTQRLLDRVDRVLAEAAWFTDPRLWPAMEKIILYGNYKHPCQRYSIPSKTPRLSNSTRLLLNEVDRILARAKKYTHRPRWLDEMDRNIAWAKKYI
jgi:HK97 family phage prohead protease